MEELLPVGSKVKLQNGRTFMIIGYLPSKPNDDVLYDYICCRNIYGIRKKKEDLVLNSDYFYIKKEDISEVLYIGFSDMESNQLIQYASFIKSGLNEAKKEKSNLNQEELNDIYFNVYKKVIGEHGDEDDER